MAAVPDELTDIGRPAGESTQVHVSVFISDLNKIDSVNQSFFANVLFTFRWRDVHLDMEKPLELRIVNPTSLDPIDDLN